jgi:hypothetical protein
MRKIPRIQSLKENDEIIDEVAPEVTDAAPVADDLPNEITVTWKLSDDMENVLLTAITINGNPVEGVEDPEASITELAGFSATLDIDQDRLGELLVAGNLQEDADGDGMSDELIPPSDEPSTENEDTDTDSDAELVFESPRYYTKQNLTEAPVWKWATGQA